VQGCRQRLARELRHTYGLSMHTKYIVRAYFLSLPSAFLDIVALLFSDVRSHHNFQPGSIPQTSLLPPVNI
jgi:hypothetical protein